MRRWLMFIAVLFAGRATAQAPNFFKDGAVWNYEANIINTPEPNYPNYYYKFKYAVHGDTVLNGVEYNRIFTTIETTVDPPQIGAPSYTGYDSIGPEFIRMDTIARRVYYLKHADSTEQLLYDFGLQQGDTIPLDDNFIVDSITTITFAGVSIKRFSLDPVCCLPDEDYAVYEGIGSTGGLLFFNPQFTTVSPGTLMCRLVCFRYLGDTLAGYSSGCQDLAMPNAIQTLVQGDQKLYPNPADKEFAFQTSKHREGTLLIADANGRVVRSVTVERGIHQAVVNVSDLPNGLYVVEIIDETLVTTRSKLIVLH